MQQFIEIINSPVEAAVANLEGMEPLKGASCGREGVVSVAAMAVWDGGTGGCVPVPAVGWHPVVGRPRTGW